MEMTMAIALSTKPKFDTLQEYTIPNSSANEMYTKLSNHHGDQFGKCKITVGGKLKVAKIRVLTAGKHKELIGKITFAIWCDQKGLKIQHAYEGKTTLKDIAMLLVDAEELPLYLQRQITENH